ncbi:MAG: DMT family transporter [Bacteroidetes bacterium]|nr:DMT family transporter [Bacteroidota bacterium]
MRHAGEIAALITAMFWTITALSFEAASKRIGSMVVNLLRLIVGFVFLSIFAWIYRGYLFPVDATPQTWMILIISGLIGFTFGDLCLFQSFVVIGARISMLLMALAPPFAAVISWFFLGEKMTTLGLVGMMVTITGIALVVLKREDHPVELNGRRKVRFNYPIWGILLGLGGALGQSTGLVLSKYGMKDYDAFASAQIRVIAGIAGFVVLFFILGLWKNTYKALSNTRALGQLSLGAFFGPFLGVSFSLIAVQHANMGIAATIMAIVPVLIIPPSVILFKEKVTVKEVAGAILAVGGVALFFL